MNLSIDNSGAPAHERFLVTKEAARLLTLSHRTLEEWRLKGFGPPFIKAGRRRVLYKFSDIIAWLNEQTFRNTGEAGA